MQHLLNELRNEMQMLKIKASLQDGAAQIRNSRIWLPNFPMDVIQRVIIMSNNYWDMSGLEIINKHLVEDAVIVDIGANIGSHSLYWAIECNASKIYAFEPLPAMFEVLEKNIDLNNLHGRVIPHNFGLLDVETNAEIHHYDPNNIGATAFRPSETGPFKLKTLDSLKIPEKVDLIKIDAKDAEVEILYGAFELIKRDKPVIVLESYNRRQQVDRVLSAIGYTLAETIRENEDFIYKYSEFM